MKSNNYVTRKLAIFVLVTGLAIVMSSCATETVLPQEVNTVEAEIDAKLETMAKLVAQTLTNKDTRIALKEAANERFGGDTEVLYKDFANKAMTNGTSFQDQLAVAYSESVTAQQDSLSLSAANSELNTLATSIPKLQIALRTDIDAWDVEDSSPLVAFTPVSIDDSELTEVTAFDAEGNVYKLDATTPPDRTVIVVGLNERTDEAGNILPEFAPSEASEEAADIEVQACKNANLLSMWLRDKREPWHAGDPEIMIIAKSVSNRAVVSGVGYHADLKYVNDTGKWYYTRKYTIGDLNLGCTSNDVVYYFYERDSFSLPFIAKYKGLSLEVTISNEDDFIGSFRVPYEQFGGKHNFRDTGNMAFYTN